MLQNTKTLYGSVSKFLHWTIFLLVVGMLTFGYFLSYIPESYAGMAYNSHKLIGLLILFLMLTRALWASLNLKPVLPVDTPAWQRVAERVVHYGLYLGILAMPLVAWVGSTAAGKPPRLGGLALNFPLQLDKASVQPLFNLHGLIALIIIALVSVHVFAALYHHFICKDNILKRMLPFYANNTLKPRV